MANCGSNTLVIGRPSEGYYNYMQCAGTSGNSATASACGSISACNSPVAPHDRPNMTKRTNREKVREDIKDYVLLMLGAPTIKIELDQQALDFAVDQALSIFEEYAGREYYDYYTFNTTPGKSVYKMPDDVGMIRNVFYKKVPNFSFTARDLGGAIPVEYFYPGGAYSSIQGGLIDPVQPIWARSGEWMLYKQYEQMFARMSSNIGGWEWVSDRQYIKLYPVPYNCSGVIVHYLQKCKDWREVTQAMQEGAYAHALIILGNIRSKYDMQLGPSGGARLNGDRMLEKGYELKEKWQEELIYKFGDGGALAITLD